MVNDDVLKKFSGKNVLVTGGTGLIGRQIVDILCSAEANIKVISLDKINIDERVEYIIGDLNNYNVCDNVTRGVDYVFHLAGIKGSMKVSTTMPVSHFVPTMMINLNVLEASRKNNVEKLVYTSSIGAYSANEIFKEDEYSLTSEPMDLAGWAKRMAELQIQTYKTQYDMENFAIVRPCNVYGPGDNFDPDNAMVIPSLMMRIHRGEDPLLVWGDGSAIRDFAYSKDVADGIILALHYGTRGDFVNLGSGKGVSIKKLVETLHSFLDFNYEFDTNKSSGFPKRVMDISRAREWIGYNPTTSLLDGLTNTWNWFQDHQGEYLKRKNYFFDD